MAVVGTASLTNLESCGPPCGLARFVENIPLPFFAMSAEDVETLHSTQPSPRSEQVKTWWTAAGRSSRVHKVQAWAWCVSPGTSYLYAGLELQSKAESIALDIPPQVLEFLAHKISSNIRELEGALNRIEAHAILIGRPVTLEMVLDVLHDLLKANDRRVTIENSKIENRG